MIWSETSGRLKAMGCRTAPVLALAVLVQIALLAPATAQSHWTNGGGDAKWSNGANWTPSGVPTGSVVINNAPIVLLDTDESIIGTVTITGPGLTVEKGGSLTQTYSSQPGGTTFSIGGAGAPKVQLKDAGSQLVSEANGNTIGQIEVGTKAGYGELHVLAGTSTSGYAVEIAHDEGTVGFMIVQGGTVSIPSPPSFRGWMSVGFGGIGTLQIVAGGTVTSQVGALATTKTGDATVLVDGAGSTWTITGGTEFHVGGGGTAELDIKNGGKVDAQASAVVLGGRDGAMFGTGTVTVSGPNAVLQNTNTIAIGQYGTGTLTVSDAGAVVTTGAIQIAQQAGSTGTLNIGAAAGGPAAAAGTVTAGEIQFGAGTGTINFNHNTPNYVFATKISGPDNGAVNVLAGTTIFTADNTYSGLTTIASGARLDLGNGGTTGSITGPVLDNGILAFNHSNTFIVPGVIAGIGSVQQNGTGTTILTADNLYTGGTTINAGALQLGNGGLSGSIVGDVTNNGTLIFNRSNVYDFTGTISGTGGVAQNGPGTTIFNTPQTYTGTTNINAGLLEVNSTLASLAVNVNAGGTLGGIGTLAGHVVNAGVISPGTSTGGFGTLTVASYAGLGGTLAIDTQLGGDSSPTDLLRVNGDTSGTTNVKVTNVGGAGAQTVQGIEIVSVGGASDGNFNLLGDYSFYGAQAVIAGAYAYTLQKDGNNWYLRSTYNDTVPGLVLPPGLPPSGPIYQPGVGLYEAYPQILLNLMALPTFRERVGNRYAGGNAYTAPAAYVPAGASYLGGPVGMPYAAAEPVDTSRAWWGRVDGQRSRMEPSFSTSGATYHADQVRLQTGADALLYADAGGQLIGGVTVQQGNAWARIRSVWGNGKVDTDAYGIGGTLTWVGAAGFYVDTQAQVNWFNTDVRSDLAGPMSDGENGVGYALGIEVGKRFGFGRGLAVTPQAQLAYTDVHSDFSDLFAVDVAIEDGDSLIGRLGVALEYRDAWMGTAGPTATRLYGIANLYYEFLDGTRVDLSGTPFRMEREELWGGLGLGGTYAWAGDTYALYGEVSYNTSLENFGDSYSVQGTAGLRIRW